jgi:urea-proton symporter
MSISISVAISVLGSLLKPEDFNFIVMTQKIVEAEERIRSIIERDSDDYVLKGIAQFSYRYAIAISIILAIVWPLPLYISGYVSSLNAYVIWVGISII